MVDDLQLTVKEKKAVMLLAFHTSAGVVGRLMECLGYVRKRPMRHSAVTLDGLQSDALELNWTPKRAKGSPKWSEILRTSERSLELAVERWINNYESMPASMRTGSVEQIVCIALRA
eukprot:14416351-Alexandrium_andersonii.AAC.1